MRVVLFLIASFAAACSFPSVDYVDPDASIGGASSTSTTTTTAASTGGSATGCAATSDCIGAAQSCAQTALQTAEPACEAMCMGPMQGKCKDMCPTKVLQPCETTCEGCAHAKGCMGMDATMACDAAVGL